MKKILSILFLLVSSNSLFCQSLQEIISSEKIPEKLIEKLQIFYKESENPEEKLAVLLKLAYFEEILGNLDIAQQHYQEAAFLFVNQQSHTALLRSALLLFELGEYASSLEQAKIVKELSKNLEEREMAELLIIRNLLAEEKREESETLFHRMIKDLERSRNLTLLYGLYDLATFLKNDETAQKIVSLLENNFPNSLETDLVRRRIDPYPSFFQYFLNHSKELPQISVPEQKNKTIYIQLGSFLERENAEYRKLDAEKAGFTVEIKEVLLNNRIYYRLLLPVEEESIQQMILQLKEKGFEGYPLYPAIQ